MTKMDKEIAQKMSHLQETIRRLNIQQSDDTPEITKQYGYLKFDENELDSTTRLSQYIRLALQTDATTVVKFMQYGWRLPTPDLIISVTGGGKQCNMSAHLRKTFQRGLVVAAATTNAWLITAGTNAGVVKEVGEALNNYRYKNRKHGLDVPCIGIGTWEYTAGTEQLDSPTMEYPMTSYNDVNITGQSSKASRHPRTRSTQSDVADEHYVRSYVVKQTGAKRCDLEPNHTHFLLFDGKSSNTDIVLLQRAKIEKFSRRINMEKPIADALIPIVMILAEGGPFSVRTVCQALQSNTPLVVVKGSGRAADLVADLHAFFCQVETDEYGTEQKVGTQFVKNKNDHPLAHSADEELNSIFARSRANNNTWVDEVKNDLCQVLRHRKQLVVIFEFDSQRHHGNLEDAILEALLNAAKFSGDNADEQQCRVAELKLAMAWQKFDYAQKHILTDTTISKWAEVDLFKALVDALRRGYVDFVELLMDYGTSLEKLTFYNLEQLYASSDIGDGLPVKEENKKDSPTRDDYYSSYFPDQSDFNRTAVDKNLPLGQNAAREFFLWAIFLDRFELAKYLCSKTWNQSTAPLIAARIYRLAITMALHSETRQHYNNNASQFDTYAMSIIDRCFDNDEYFGVDLLRQPVVAFDNVEPLKLAEQAKCRAFLASKCVQRYLDQKWFGHINYKRQAIRLRIFLCSIFFPLLPFFSIFLPYVHEHQQIIRSNKNRLKNRKLAIRSGRYVEDDRIRWSQKLVYFYQAPIVRFCYNVIFFVIFLGLFSFVLLIDFLPLNTYYEKSLPLPITEITLHICIWSLIMEELRQFSLTKPVEYFSDIWNLIDFTAIIIYLVAFITRFIVIETFFIISKIFFCLDLITWFISTLHLFAAFERLGPKLVMIFNTMKDLFFFVCFILIFLCGFSITSWSLISTASQVKWIYNDDGQLLNVTVTFDGNNSRTWHLLRDITHYGVWKVFGQVDPIVGTDPYSNMAFILAIVFVAIANILLLNVLIALFNVTIQNVQEQSHDLWRYQRFLIVKEYTKKTPLASPFNIIYYIFITVRLLIIRIKLYRNRHRSITRETLLDDIKTIDNNIQQQFKITDAMRREKAIADDYWRYTFKHNKNDRMEVILQNIEQKIDHLTPSMQDNNKLTLINHQSDKQVNVESDV